MTSPLTIYYSHKGLQPPVYVAGSWTNPPWQPHEMSVSDTKTDDGEFRFVKHFEAVKEGQYQYKFRLGPGDWWVTDDNAETATDSSGNKNNLVTVKGEPPAEENERPASSEPVNEAKATVSAPIKEDTDANASSTIASSTPSESNGSTVENETKAAHPVLDKVDTALVNGDSQALKDDAPQESAPIPYTVVETVRDKEQPVYGDLETARLEADPSKRAQDAQPDAEYPIPPTNAPPSPSSVKSPKDITIPQLIVEKTDDTLRHGDDFGPHASSGQKLAHSLHKADAQPDEVLISPPTSPTMSTRSVDNHSKDSSSAIPKDASPEALKEAAPEGPKEAAPEIPKVASEIAKDDIPDAPKDNSLEVTEVPSQIPKEASPAVPEDVAPEIPKVASEIAKDDIPDAPKDTSLEVTEVTSQIPKEASPTVPNNVAPETPEDTASEIVKEAEVSSDTSPETLKDNIPEVSKDTSHEVTEVTSQIPKETSPAIPKQVAPETPKATSEIVKEAETPRDISPETLKDDIPEVPKDTSHEVTEVPSQIPKENSPTTPKDASPETLKEAAPEVSKDIPPETLKATPEVPKDTSPEITKVAPQIPTDASPEKPKDTTSLETPKDTTPEVPKITTLEISKDASPEIPNNASLAVQNDTSPELPEDSDASAPLLPHERTAEVDEDIGGALEVPLFSHECTFEESDDEAVPRIPSMERVRIEGGVPLFPHEIAAGEEPGSPGLSMPRNRSITSLRSMRSLKSAELDEDPNDPSVEPFPTNREDIYEHIRRTENRLPEDDSVYHTELSPTLNGQLSPAVISQGAPSSIGPGSPLRPITEADQDAEDDDVEEAPLPSPLGSVTGRKSTPDVPTSHNAEPSTAREQTPDPEDKPDEERNLDAPPTPPLTPKDKERQARPEPLVEAVPTEASSSRVAVSSLSEDVPDEIQTPHTLAKAEGVRQRKTSPERSSQTVITTSQSTPPASKREGGFLSAFWGVLFGSWLGPLGHWLASLLGSKRNTVLSFTIIVAVGASGAAYYLSSPVS